MDTKNSFTLSKTSQYVEYVLFQEHCKRQDELKVLEQVSEEIKSLPKFLSLHLFMCRFKRIVKSIF